MKKRWDQYIATMKIDLTAYWKLIIESPSMISETGSTSGQN